MGGPVPKTIVYESNELPHRDREAIPSLITLAQTHSEEKEPFLIGYNWLSHILVQNRCAWSACSGVLARLEKVHCSAALLDGLLSGLLALSS